MLMRYDLEGKLSGVVMRLSHATASKSLSELTRETMPL